VGGVGVRMRLGESRRACGACGMPVLEGRMSWMGCYRGYWRDLCHWTCVDCPLTRLLVLLLTAHCSLLPLTMAQDPSMMAHGQLRYISRAYSLSTTESWPRRRSRLTSTVDGSKANKGGGETERPAD
jgi:hypothetical protein